VSAPGGDPAPYYTRHVFCCVNQRAAGDARGCCRAKGAVKLRDHLKARVAALRLTGVRINAAGCLGRCALGPTLVIYPEGVWYGAASPEDIDEILHTHIIGGGRVARLLLDPPVAPAQPGRAGGRR